MKMRQIEVLVTGSAKERDVPQGRGREGWARIGGGVLTGSEEHTLRNRVRGYLSQCSERRDIEAKRRDEAKSRQKTLCPACNGEGEVRKRVWSDRYQRYVYAEGKMPCTCTFAPSVTS